MIRWIYRLLKALFVLALTVSALGKITLNPVLADAFVALGYPIYTMTILGSFYLLGIVGIVQSRSPTIREWAYAGFVFALSGSFLSHLLAQQPLARSIPSLVLLAVIVTVYGLEKHLSMADRATRNTG